MTMTSSRLVETEMRRRLVDGCLFSCSSTKQATTRLSASKEKKNTVFGFGFSPPESSPLHATQQTGGVEAEEILLRKKQQTNKLEPIESLTSTDSIGADPVPHVWFNLACFYSRQSGSFAPAVRASLDMAKPRRGRLAFLGCGCFGDQVRRKVAEDEYPVKLHIYDLSQGMARQLSTTLLGKAIEAIWHTGVVVHGKEYYFGRGIQQGPPGRTPYGTPARVEHLGVTHIAMEDFEDFLQEISPRYTPQTYNLLTNNCNHLSNEVVKFLVGSTVPDYILDQPKEAMKSPIGALIMPMIQGLETTMRAGAAPQFVPAPAAAAQTQPSTNDIQMQSESAAGGETGDDKTADHDSGIIPAPKEAGQIQPFTNNAQIQSTSVAPHETDTDGGIIPPVVLPTTTETGQAQTTNNDQVESRSVNTNETDGDETTDNDGGIILPSAKPAAPAAATQTEPILSSIEAHTMDEGTRLPAVQPVTVAQVTVAAAAAPDPLREAKSRVQEEIKQEFAAIMATGTVQTGEAAATAMRRVMERHGQQRATVPTQRG